MNVENKMFNKDLFTFFEFRVTGWQVMHMHALCSYVGIVHIFVERVILSGSQQWGEGGAPS